MGFLSSVGGLINDVMGGTSASKKQYQQQVALNNMSYKQQKEFAQNAHQWEMNDLIKTGLNPALTAGGNSAGTIAGGGKTGGSTQAVTNGNIMGVIGNILEYKNQNEINSAMVKKTGAETELIQLQAVRQALENNNLPEEQRKKLQLMESQITANIATSAEKFSKANLNKQEFELNAPVITEEDVDKTIKDLEDKDKSTWEKIKSTGKTLGKAFLLGVNKR